MILRSLAAVTNLPFILRYRDAAGDQREITSGAQIAQQVCILKHVGIDSLLLRIDNSTMPRCKERIVDPLAQATVRLVLGRIACM